MPNHSNFNILWLLLKIWILGSENSNSGFRYKNGTMWFLTFFLIRGRKVKNFGILGHVCSGRVFILSIYVQKPVKIDWKCRSTSSPWKGPPKWPVWQAFGSLTSKNVKISSPSLQNTKILPKMWNLGLFLATEKHGKNPRSHNTEVWDCYDSSINVEGLKNDFWKNFHDTLCFQLLLGQSNHPFRSLECQNLTKDNKVTIK